MADFEMATASETVEIYMPSSEKGKEYFDHIKKINDLFYDKIKISDQKAAYIFTFMLAFLVSSSEGKSVFTWSRYVDGDVIRIILSVMLASASTFSILSAIFAVLPRRFKSSTSLFWGTWPQHRDSFSKAAHEGNVEYLFQQYLDNADILATIARDKYRCVTLAFRGLVMTVLAYVALLVAM